MKGKCLVIALITFVFSVGTSNAQLGGFGKKLLDKGTELALDGGVNKVL
jgi:hypothetical protein